MIEKHIIILEKGATMLHQLTWSHYIKLLLYNDEN